MSRAFARAGIQAAVALCLGAPLPSGVLKAQPSVVVVSARMSSHPIARPGPDSGKVILALTISGLPEVGRRGLQLDQLLVVGAEGRAYSAFGIGYSAREKTPASILAQYTRTVPQGEPQYFFVVSPGSGAFELRVPTLRPVRFNASLMGPR
ncbi:hypothetical protein GPROT1_02017 [Gammaproteobacteria bacterium]|nr:hypothetical protein GPROT1_02017 [Gammaproteobacteria bacterium]